MKHSIDADIMLRRIVAVLTGDRALLYTNQVCVQVKNKQQLTMKKPLYN